MVFFTCNACGESLKKAQVEKHVNICRSCNTLSCIDCGKDFWGDDYKNHLKCISEDQKYGGKGYEAKSNKGDVKQQQWIQRIHDAMNKPGISPKLKDVLSQVSSYDNVPRKKAKFQNWMKNSLKIHNTALHDQVWDIFSEATSNTSATPKPGVATQPTESEAKPPASAQAEENAQEAVPKEKKKNKRDRKEERQKKGKKKRGEENGVTAQQLEGEGEGADGTEKRGKKQKKRKMNEEETPVGNGEGQTENGHTLEGGIPAKKVKKSKKGQPEVNAQAVEAEQKTGDDDDEGESNPKGKFNWKGTIKAVLKDAPEEGMPIKKLRKKVLAEYYNVSGEGNHKSEEELLALFSKKVNSNPKFRVLKEKVRLVK
ncbi:cell growth-regulating nucleolar protein [Conger conger]|uniref:cell growth-regulating nucleolar protein n=1 Tax=Conger conger TaxID=82655 RepID=UPI002A59AAB6|nr:cell growth-regulating nucleolar protein [Conger conger]